MDKVWRLLPYQARWVNDDSPVKVVEKSRRIGLSWAEAYDSVMHAAAGEGSVSYISFSKDMTAGFVRDCADWAERLQVVVAAAEESILSDAGRQILVHTIRFDSGCRIEALSSAPRQLRSRGRPGDRVVIDEAAFVDDVDTLLQAALATRIWGGSVRIISTHNGELNPFNLLIRDVRAGKLLYSLHSIPLGRALDDGLFERIQEVGGATASQTRDAWEQAIRGSFRYPWQAAEELDCIPSAGAGGWLSLEDIHACEKPEAGDPHRVGDGSVWIGYDVARRRDLAAIAALERLGDVLWLRELVVLHDRPFREQTDLVSAMVARYQPVRVAVDQTGMGEAVVEQLQARHGSRIEGVLLTSDRRLSVATALREAFEERRIRIPADDALRADLRSVKRAPGVTGDRPRLVSDGDTDGHADRFWALALACAAAARPPAEYAYTPVRLPDRWTERPDDRDDDGFYGRYPNPPRGRRYAGGLW